MKRPALEMAVRRPRKPEASPTVPPLQTHSEQLTIAPRTARRSRERSPGQLGTGPWRPSSTWSNACAWQAIGNWRRRFNLPPQQAGVGAAQCDVNGGDGDDEPADGGRGLPRALRRPQGCELRSARAGSLCAGVLHHGEYRLHAGLERAAQLAPEDPIVRCVVASVPPRMWRWLR
jgi:hypothetical protein